MQRLTLPEKLLGKWIWMREENPAIESHQFFRSDFTLSQIAGKAELWIAAKSKFHLYVNGRHCAVGRTSTLANCCYAYCVDVNYLVQVGINQIGIEVTNPNFPQINAVQNSAGLWVQLEIDDEPVLWSNENWCGCNPACFIYPGLFQTIGGCPVEVIDYRRYPHSWLRQEVSFRTFMEENQPAWDIGQQIAGKQQWLPPQIVIPLEDSRDILEAAPNYADNIEPQSWREIACQGTFRQIRQTMWVNFRNYVGDRGAGIYAAETWLYADRPLRQTVYCYCNRPYRFFANGNLVAQQAVEPPPVVSAPDTRGRRQLSLVEYEPSEIHIELSAGWNRLVWAEDCADSDAGMTMIWQEAEVGTLPIFRRQDNDSEHGWNIAGPLRTPLSLFFPTLSFPDNSRSFFDLQDNPPIDTSLHLCACSYNGLAPVAGHERDQTVSLGDKSYIVYDFGHTVYGYPCVAATGELGDRLEIVCGEIFQDGEVIGFSGGRRNVSTMILSGSRDIWLAAHPKGFRYIMLLASAANDKITIDMVQIRIPLRPAGNAGTFLCSDETFNAIWNTGVATLENTIRGRFLDAPSRDQAQYIADAMIQSWASYHVNGDFSLAANALEAFAHSQLETGELNSVSPSGLFQALPDYSLLWVVWLHRHIMYTGDGKLLQKLLPTMERLLAYYDYLAVRPDGPLGDLHDINGSYCFLDYDDIDRQGISTGLNAIYCRALFSAAWLEEQSERFDEGKRYRKRAVSVAAQIRDLTWDAENCLFADSFHNAEMSRHYSWQSNVLALYGGIASPKHYEKIWNTLFIDTPPFELHSRGSTNNPYFKFFLLEVAFALGKPVWGLSLLKHYWGKMLEAGATSWWEMFDPGETNSENRVCSKCHGYGVSPNAFLISEMVGIRPSEPGLSRVFFNPCPGVVEAVKAQIPTTYGRITVEWQVTPDKGLNVFIAANYPLEVIPILNAEIAESTVINVSEEVTILAPDEDDLNGGDGIAAELTLTLTDE